MAGSEIIVCDKRYDIENPVVTFEDEKGYSAYVPHRTDDISEIYAFDPAPGLKQRASRYRLRRMMGESRSLSRLRQVVRQVVVHLDGCMSAQMCFEVLHNQRGLSVHFMVDNDGTIYQTLDLVHCSFHAGGVNEVSVGIELQNRGDAARYPKAYPKGRAVVTCRVHGVQFLSYDFTEAQYEAMIRLGRALTRIFDIPLTSPHEGGKPVWTTIPRVRDFQGFIGHYHIIDQKWDPGPWDFPRFLHGIGSRIALPLSEAPSGPAAEGALERAAAPYFDNSEQDVGAHFPVGPLGYSRLWHGGVHLHAGEETAVHAALRGRVVAARLGPPCPVGSCNFVLLRHDFTVTRPWTIFSLYFHLAWPEVPDEASLPPWVKRARAEGVRSLESGETALLGINVEPGEVIGAVGEAGPPGYREEQIHFAVFGAEELGRELEPGYWEVIEASSSRLCSDRGILARIDRPQSGKPPDGLLSRRELRAFFSGSARRQELHRLVVRHRSEWTPGGWEELASAPDFADLPPAQRQRLLAQQITPTLWWTPEVARHAGLPADGMIYSYHPIGLLVWLERMTKKFASQRGKGIEAADRWEGKMAPKNLTVDAESGDAMTDEEDFHSGELSKKLTLEDIVNGYPDD